MLPAIQSQSLALLLSREQKLTDLRNQREVAQQQGNKELVAELSVEILNRVEEGAAAIAADAKLQNNEKIKYSSTFVNTMAAGIFSAGVATPVIGIFAPGSLYASNYLLLGEISGGCLIVAMALHMVARAMLNRLRA